MTVIFCFEENLLLAVAGADSLGLFCRSQKVVLWYEVSCDSNDIRRNSNQKRNLKNGIRTEERC